MNNKPKIAQPDVQNSVDNRGIQLTRVGNIGIRRRIIVERKNHSYQFISKINIYSLLTGDKKGLNLSRFTEAVFNVPQKTSSVEQYAKDVAELCKIKQEADCFIEIESNFPYEKYKDDGRYEEFIYPLKITYNTKTKFFTLSTSAIGMSYCICGRDMCAAKLGINQNISPSHNQRSIISVKLYFKDKQIVKSGKIIDAINKSFSSSVYHILKRPEERDLILNAAKNAKFSEDECRDCLIELRRISELIGLSVIIKVRNEESIHESDVESIYEGVI